MAEYIEREALLDSLSKMVKELEYADGKDDYLFAYGNLSGVRRSIIHTKATPAADVVEVRNGEWVWTEHGEEDYEQFWRCSCCGDATYYECNYCPHCGAKMDGKGEGE